MNIENLAIEKQQALSAERPEDRDPQQPADITPLPPETFQLIGGGSGIVVL
jgi:hypothetical protein